MKIIRRRSDGIVSYFFNDEDEVVLTETHLYGVVIAADIKLSTHELLLNVTQPSLVKLGGVLSYTNDAWAVVDQSRYDGHVAETGLLAAAKTKKTAIDNAIATYNTALAALEAAYPQRVRDTWPQQSAEAKAYQADPNATTAFLDGMLAKKPGVTKAELVTKILNNYTAYSTLVGAALGAMQTTIEQINNP